MRARERAFVACVWAHATRGDEGVVETVFSRVVFVVFVVFEFELVVHGGCASAVGAPVCRALGGGWERARRASGADAATKVRGSGRTLSSRAHGAVRVGGGRRRGGVGDAGRGGEAARTRDVRLGESARRRGGGQEEEI